MGNFPGHKAQPRTLQTGLGQYKSCTDLTTVGPKLVPEQSFPSTFNPATSFVQCFSLPSSALPFRNKENFSVLRRNPILWKTPRRSLRMGLLSEGTPLSWPDSAPYRQRVKTDGIKQFLNIYHAAKDFHNLDLKWGDEVEYQLLRLDSSRKRATLSLRAPELLEELQREEHSQPEGSSVPVLWRPEYARWMIEGTPGVPYRCYATDLVNVERNMALRRIEIAKLLRPDETVLTITSFPRTGCGVFTSPPTVPFGPVSRSLFSSDDVISPHPRFPTLTKNIRVRREEKVDMRVPLFIDENTKRTQYLVPRDPSHLALLDRARAKLSSDGSDSTDKSLLEEGLEKKVTNEIVVDATVFGMGSSCLQVTIQGRDIGESRYLYDQLAVMAPLLLALTAATPVVRGLLADTDVRWDVISGAMDDRTPDERETGSIPKSRYSSIDMFLSCREKMQAESYNDIPVPINDEAYYRLIQGGVDHLLAKHIAHLFVRDPLAIYKEKVEQDNSTSTDHFENIQSTNWNTVRFKPPPPGNGIGWRTELRSMEVCLTDFENAAFSVFSVLLSRVILAFNLNFYVPMSKVDENMNRAHARDAARNEKFYFRKNVFKSSDGSGFLCECGHIHNASLVGGQAESHDIDRFCRDSGESDGSGSESEVFEEMSLDEIFNGKPRCRNGRFTGFEFPGLIPLMRGYLDALEVDPKTKRKLLSYLDFVSERASGALCTNAAYIRQYIQRHPEYKRDSVVSDSITYDLVKHLEGITKGDITAPELLGRFQTEGVSVERETPRTMLARMQRKPEGREGTLLHGSSMPRWALEATIRSIASVTHDQSQCECSS